MLFIEVILTLRKEVVNMKNKNYNKKYFIGLDLGTNSVGWAVMDEAYKVIRYKGNHMWGVRLIDDVNTAENRRHQRASRRHYERRKDRINLLRQLIGGMVLEVDENFFIRLENSFFKHESIDQEFGKPNLYTLFDGKVYNDQQYYNKYPTIYHLERALIEEDRQFDPREIYLVLHHMVKYRGNFLYQDNINEISNLENAVGNYFEKFSQQNFDDEINPFATKIAEIVNILQDKNVPKYISKKVKEQALQNGAIEDLLTKQEKIDKLFDDNKLKKIIKEFCLAIQGKQFSLSVVLGLEEPKDREEKKADKVSFKKDFSDDKKEQTYEAVGDSEILKSLEICYNTYLFGDIRGNNTYICNAMCDKFDKHKEDLKILKALINEMDIQADRIDDKGRFVRQYYKEMFVSCKDKLANYASYVKNHNNKYHCYKVCDVDDFYKYVKKVLENAKDSEYKQYILDEIEKNSFMPKQNDVSNGAIPYQFNLEMMSKIIDNQSKYYPVLAETKVKILSILTFRRPYYVGVLTNDANNPYAWSQGLFPTDKKLYPWNFMQEIDKDLLAERFINKMSGKCCYYKEEKVLPKQSIIYQAYCCLNELNKLSIKGNRITPELRKWLFDNVVCRYSSVNVDTLIKELKIYNANLYGDVTAKDIAGLSEKGKLSNNMSTYRWLKQTLKENFNMAYLDVYEEYVSNNTVFSDVDIRRDRLKAQNANGIFSDKNIDTLKKKDFKGWGRYSKRFLHGEITSVNDRTILEELYEGWYYNKNNCKCCYNINELLYDKRLGIKEQIEAIDSPKIEKYNFGKHIKDLYASPKDKSIIWQAICVVEEIVKIMGHNPDNIFIETTREDDVKKKSKTRYDNLKELYKYITTDEANIEALAKMEYLNGIDEKMRNTIMSNDKMYLYLLQLGKCMYSLEDLSIDKFEEYEIDHIVAQAYTKDDSFSNRVLVKRIENQRKRDDLTLKKEVIDKMTSFWQMLRDHRFISNKKYLALTKNEIRDDDIKRFINRQLVETNQIIKLTSQLLSRKYATHEYDEASIVKGVKASLSSQFRQAHMDRYAGFTKLRNLNDMHHAKDAYLAAVIGAFTTYEYPCWGNSWQADWIRRKIKELADKEDQNPQEYKKLMRMSNGIVIDAITKMRDGYDEETGEIIPRYENIKKTMSHNDCIVTKKLDEKANTQFYNETLYPAQDATFRKLIPQRRPKNRKGLNKELPVELYGGFTSENPGHFAIVRYEEDGRLRYVLVAIPVMIIYQEKSDKNAIINYLKARDRKFENAEIIRRVSRNQQIILGGQLVYIVSQSEVNNAVQMVVDQKYEKLLYIVEQFAKTKNIEIINEKKHYNIKSGLKKEIEKISQSDLTDEFVLYFINKINKHYPLNIAIAKKIKDYYTEKGVNLSIYEKLNFINELIKITTAGPRLANLKEYGLSVAAGKLNGKTIDCQQVSWVHQSITGLYSVVEKGVKE